MKKESDIFWDSTRAQKAKELDMTPAQVITLASIVSQESNIAAEYPVIAGVYINRLKREIPLQADPTVKFATGDDSLKRILRKHLETDSPYNTYLYKGLPPGPIVIPPLKAVDEFLIQQTQLPVFLRKTFAGRHHNFAVSLSEHNRNTTAYPELLKLRKR